MDRRIFRRICTPPPERDRLANGNALLEVDFDFEQEKRLLAPTKEILYNALRTHRYYLPSMKSPISVQIVLLEIRSKKTWMPKSGQIVNKNCIKAPPATILVTMLIKALSDVLLLGDRFFK